MSSSPVSSVGAATSSSSCSVASSSWGQAGKQRGRAVGGDFFSPAGAAFLWSFEQQVLPAGATHEEQRPGGQQLRQLHPNLVQVQPLTEMNNQLGQPGRGSQTRRQLQVAVPGDCDERGGMQWCWLPSCCASEASPYPLCLAGLDGQRLQGGKVSARRRQLLCLNPKQRQGSEAWQPCSRRDGGERALAQR